MVLIVILDFCQEVKQKQSINQKKVIEGEFIQYNLLYGESLTLEVTFSEEYYSTLILRLLPIYIKVTL